VEEVSCGNGLCKNANYGKCEDIKWAVTKPEVCFWEGQKERFLEKMRNVAPGKKEETKNKQGCCECKCTYNGKSDDTTGNPDMLHHRDEPFLNITHLKVDSGRPGQLETLWEMNNTRDVDALFLSWFAFNDTELNMKMIEKTTRNEEVMVNKLYRSYYSCVSYLLPSFLGKNRFSSKGECMKRSVIPAEVPRKEISGYSDDTPELQFEKIVYNTLNATSAHLTWKVVLDKLHYYLEGFNIFWYEEGETEISGELVWEGQMSTREFTVTGLKENAKYRICVDMLTFDWDKNDNGPLGPKKWDLVGECVNLETWTSRLPVNENNCGNSNLLITGLFHNVLEPQDAHLTWTSPEPILLSWVTEASKVGISELIDVGKSEFQMNKLLPGGTRYKFCAGEIKNGFGEPRGFECADLKTV
jgi:hypothetical protein